MGKTALGACVFFITQQYSTAQVNGGGTQSQPSPPPIAQSRQAKFTPMTQEERLRYYFRTTFSVESVLRSSAGAGISQWTNTPSEWGQGGEGYARRLGNSYAQHIMQSTMMYGASSVLREDNRYIPSGESTFGPRLKYAIATSFLARRDDGSRRLSFSRLGSYVATAFISREWQPHSTNGAQNAAATFGTSMGITVGFNVAREFFPKIFRRH
jgi:hypothetical protein